MENVVNSSTDKYMHIMHKYSLTELLAWQYTLGVVKSDHELGVE